MSQELKMYLKLMFVLVFFWLMGGFVDSALWSHATYNTPKWVIDQIDIIWLSLSQFLLPLAMVMILKPKLNSFIAFMSAACFGSMAWDLAYSLLTTGLFIGNTMNRWYALDEIGLVIRIPQEYIPYFYLARFIVGVSFFIWLKRRLDKETISL